MICPDCQALLQAEFHFGIEIDACTHCSGAWYDGGELQRYRSAQENRNVPEEPPEFIEEESTRACPRCQEGLLREATSAGESLAACLTCRGVWLPRGRPILAEAQDRSDWTWLWEALYFLGISFEE